MKRKLIYAAAFILISLTFPECQKDCKVCQQNQYDSGGNLLVTGTESEYCGLELIGIENTKDNTTGGITTKWVCR
jgi:hypothetical protein